MKSVDLARKLRREAAFEPAALDRGKAALMAAIRPEVERVSRHLYPGGRPRSPEETARWLQSQLANYEGLGLGALAVVRKEDGALMGRCGLNDLVVESMEPEQGIRKGWFGRRDAPSGVALTFECELAYTFDPAAWGRGFASEAAQCVRDYARDVLGLPYAISAILPENGRSRRVAERSGARLAGRMDVWDLTWERWLWPLADARPESALAPR
jgi:RimJ/RimL family protein N-acetyltransferase